MAKNKTAVMALVPALDRESYKWLLAYDADIAEKLEIDVRNGHSSRDIYYLVLGQTHRQELAVRCQAAARHLKRVEGAK